MLDPKLRAELDQAAAGLGEAMPQLWKELHRGLKEEFTEQEAWELLKVVIFAQLGGKGLSQ